MLGIHDLPLFVVSGLLLNILPGPDSLLIVSRSASQGWRAGSAAALGIGAGTCVHVLAAALRAALARHPPPAPSTLWVTVQGRVVYIEGCAAHAAAGAELETWARSLPNVRQAIASLRTRPEAKPPYRLRSSR